MKPCEDASEASEAPTSEGSAAWLLFSFRPPLCASLLLCFCILTSFTRAASSTLLSTDTVQYSALPRSDLIPPVIGSDLPDMRLPSVSFAGVVMVALAVSVQALDYCICQGTSISHFTIGTSPVSSAVTLSA